MTGDRGASRWLTVGTAGVLALAMAAVAGGVAAAEDEAKKVILDTDMVELFDDGMAMLMLERAEDIDLLGVTVLSGNTPMPAGLAAGARQLEAMGSETPMYAGSRYGIRNWRFDPEILAAEEVISPVVSWPGYLGHYDETIGGDPMELSVFGTAVSVRKQQAGCFRISPLPA